MSNLPDDRGAELRELFFESAQELLQSLNDDALKLEKQPGDEESMRSIRRTVHTLKGDAAACGYRDLSEAAHELEDALAVQTSSPEISLVEVAFTAADTFGALVAAYRQNVPPPSAEPLHNLVKRLLASPGAADVDGQKSQRGSLAAPLPSEAEEQAIQNALGRGRQVFGISAHIDPHCAMPIAARQLVLSALSEIGEVLGERLDASPSGNTKRLWFWLATSEARERVVAKCRIPTVTAAVKVEPIQVATQVGAQPQAAEVTPEQGAKTAGISAEATAGESLAQDSAPPEPREAASKFQVAAGSDNILRVDADRIDSVLNLVGELIIGKSMLQQTLNELAKRYPREGLRGRFADAVAFQARVLNDLQRSVMKIRMVPVEQLFRRFPRMVRDVAKQCERQVELTVSGQDTDLDKGLLDAISEPLTHVVRNAITHGIESPEQRVVAGKPAAGTIHLNAYHQGNQVTIEVSDDGRGIDVQKVKAKAIQQGLITADGTAALTENEALELIFRPGFSTADHITEVAGRGVGLDVVQSVLHRLKGTVEIENRPGQGTTFRMKLPLTLAIIKALLFRVEQRLYAVPLNSVAEITRAHESDLHQVGRYEVLQLRGQPLSLVRLGKPVDFEQERARKIFVLVIALGDRRLGLIVDSLEGEEELVIKALDDQTVATDLVSGASILGDGRVVLILNLAAVVDRSSRERSGDAGQAPFGLLLSQSDRLRLTLAAAGGRS